MQHKHTHVNNEIGYTWIFCSMESVANKQEAHTGLPQKMLDAKITTIRDFEKYNTQNPQPEYHKELMHCFLPWKKMTKISVHEQISTKTSSWFSGFKISVFVKFFTRITNERRTYCEAAVVIAAHRKREGFAQKKLICNYLPQL